MTNKKKTVRKTTKARAKPAGSGLKGKMTQLTEQLEDIFSSRPQDITSAIKMDHKALRNFLDVLKDTDRDMKERRQAYASFSALLKSHSKVEEEVVYQETFKLTGKELHIKVEEGFVEHRLAKDLMKRIERTEKALEWSAHANVLSEIVEHHLKEEERDLLPEIKKAASKKLDQLMLERYIDQRSKTQQKVTSKNAGVLKAKKADKKA